MRVERLRGTNVGIARLCDLAAMMCQLKHETEPGKAVTEPKLYLEYIEAKLKVAEAYYIACSGFMIIDKVVDLLLSPPHNHYLMMTHVYVVPGKRKGRTYAKLLNTMLGDHPDEQIIGLTYKQSDHNAVMRKRYRVLGTIYGRF